MAVPGRFDLLVVMRGLILTRASVVFARIYAKKMDPRVSPRIKFGDAGDGRGWASADSAERLLDTSALKLLNGVRGAVEYKAEE